MPHRKVLKVFFIATQKGKIYLVASALAILITIFSFSALAFIIVRPIMQNNDNSPPVNSPDQFLPEGEEIPIDIINESLQVHKLECNIYCVT